MSFMYKLGRCCSLTAGGVVTSIYATVAYMAAFAMELWWIIEEEVSLPAPAYILAAGYFFTFLVSLFLLVGIFLKKPRYLLGWLVLLILFFLPECGLVVYMSVYHWTLDVKNGLLELAFYACRAFVNVLCIVCVQQLYSRWREEKAVMRRLENLHVGSVLTEMNMTGSIRKENGEIENGHANTAFAYHTPRNQSVNFYLAASGQTSKLARGPSSASTNSRYQNIRNGGPPSVSRISPGPPDRHKTSSSSSHAYWRSDKCEFDASSFSELFGRKQQTQSDLGISYTDTQVEMLNRNGLNSPMTFSTQSLERPKLKRSALSRRSRSLEEMYVPTLIDDYVLEKLSERPFQYLERPGNVGLYDDSSPDHSIRDIAL